MKWRVISESYDFRELCPNHAHFFKTATPNFLTLLIFTCINMREIRFYVTLPHQHDEDVRGLSFFITQCAHD